METFLLSPAAVTDTILIVLSESGLLKNPEVALFPFNEVYFIVVLTVVAPRTH